MLYFGGIVVGIMIGKYFGAIWAVFGAVAGLAAAHYLAQLEASESGDVSNLTTVDDDEDGFKFDEETSIIDSSCTEINPASGLPMDGCMDIAGNTFGTNSDDHFGSGSSDDF